MQLYNKIIKTSFFFFEGPRAACTGKRHQGYAIKQAIYYLLKHFGFVLHLYIYIILLQQLVSSEELTKEDKFKMEEVVR